MGGRIMALTPANIPGNLWGQNTPGRTFPVGLMVNTLLAEKELKLRKQKMLTDIVSSLDPVEFIRNKNILEQSKLIKEFEDKAAQMASGVDERGQPKRGGYTDQDILDLSFMAKNIEAQGYKKENYERALKEASKIFNDNPGEFDPMTWTSMLRLATAGEDIDPFSGLEYAVTDVKSGLEQLPPEDIWGPNNFAESKSTVTNEKTGISETIVKKAWGVTTTDKSGNKIIDEEATKSRANQRAMFSIMSNPRWMAQAVRDFDAQSEEVQIFYNDLAYKNPNTGIFESKNAQINEAAILWNGVKHAPDMLRSKQIPTTTQTIAAPEEEETPKGYTSVGETIEGDDLNIQAGIQSYSRKNVWGGKKGSGQSVVTYLVRKRTKLNVPTGVNTIKYNLNGNDYIIGVAGPDEFKKSWKGSFISDIDMGLLLQVGFDVEEAEIIDSDQFIGPDQEVRDKDNKRSYSLRTDQVVSKEEENALKSNYSDEEYEKLVSEGKFVHMTLELGTQSGVPGTLIIIKELNDAVLSTLKVPENEYPRSGDGRIFIMPTPGGDTELTYQELVDMVGEEKAQEYISNGIAKKK